MTKSPSGDFDPNEEKACNFKGAFVLEIGIWSLEFVCYLEFGIWNLSLRIASCYHYHYHYHLGL